MIFIWLFNFNFFIKKNLSELSLNDSLRFKHVSNLKNIRDILIKYLSTRFLDNEIWFGNIFILCFTTKRAGWYLLDVLDMLDLASSISSHPLRLAQIKFKQQKSHKTLTKPLTSHIPNNMSFETKEYKLTPNHMHLSRN